MPTISINIPEELLIALDKLVDSRKYSSRSRAVQDAVNDLINEFLYDCDPLEEMEGVIILTYARDNLTICGKIRTLERDYDQAIHEAIRHFHKESNLTFEIILAKGLFKDITDFVSKVKAINGVGSVRFSFVPLNEKKSLIRDVIPDSDDACD